MNKSEKNILELMHQDIKVIKKMLQQQEGLSNERPPIPQKEIRIKNPNSPATEKQKAFLEKNEYQGDVEELTKLEASKIIEMYINKEGKE